MKLYAKRQGLLSAAAIINEPDDDYDLAYEGDAWGIINAAARDLRDCGVGPNAATWGTPPENQGQAVERSYGYCYADDVIIECRDDRSTGETVYTAYESGDDEFENWDPWNRKPTLGREVGRCWVEEAV
jgi:hypothetical protein